jgi:hypothetical protein
MDFKKALQESSLATDLTAAQRPVLTPEAADLAATVSLLERNVPSAVVAFTHLCEASFNLTSRPNTNGKPACVWAWDIGPFQLNLSWTMRSIFNGDYSSHGLTFNDVFGSFGYEPDGVTPAPFSGSPVANGRLACRRLLSVHGDSASLGYESLLEMRAVRYTGPAHQERRRDLYRQLYPSFTRFFDLYKGDV